MKYGIYLPNFGPYGHAQTLPDLAQDAEKAGWEGFSFRAEADKRHPLAE